jgi:hypothetical protein
MFCMQGVQRTLAGRYELGEVIGRGGLPPGQAKKHDGSHGHSHGD